jgi:hypothetical protein
VDAVAAADKALGQLSGVKLGVADFDTFTIDGRKFDDTVQ